MSQQTRLPTAIAAVSLNGGRINVADLQRWTRWEREAVRSTISNLRNGGYLQACTATTNGVRNYVFTDVGALRAEAQDVAECRQVLENLAAGDPDANTTIYRNRRSIVLAVARLYDGTIDAHRLSLLTEWTNGIAKRAILNALWVGLFERTGHRAGVFRVYELTELGHIRSRSAEVLELMERYRPLTQKLPAQQLAPIAPAKAAPADADSDDDSDDDFPRVPAVINLPVEPYWVFSLTAHEGSPR